MSERSVSARDGRQQAEAERRFHADMVAGAARLRREIGYNPTRFLQMVGNIGGVQAARDLLAGPIVSDGFTTLWEHQRLDFSVEAFALLPWYRELFTDDQLAMAAHRLLQYGYDVDRHIRAATSSPPAWVAQDPAR
jgi:hypothetical protein